MKSQISNLKSQNCILNLKSFALCILVLSFAFFVLRLDKTEASALSLGIYPPIIKIEAVPPASIKTPIAIQNLSDETTTLKILFKPFTASDKENGEVRYLNEKEEYRLADPLIFQKIQVFENDRRVEKVTLGPSQQKTLDLHIGILKDDPLSDYYFSVIFMSEQLANLGETNLAMLAGGVATNVLLSVGPKGKIQGSIEEFSVPILLEKGPVPFTLRVKNTGERVIAPEGQILIKNMFNQTVGKVELLPVNILAGTIRAIPDSFQSPEATPPANDKWKMEDGRWSTAYWYETFLLGPYAATLTIKLAEEGPIFSRTIHFFALPVQSIIGFGIAVVVVILIINRVKKRLKASQD